LPQRRSKICRELVKPVEVDFLEVGQKVCDFGVGLGEGRKVKVLVYSRYGGLGWGRHRIKGTRRRMLLL
jgi:hypothetical protein